MEIFTRLNWVDILIVILMVRISYVAFQDGLSHEIFPLITSVMVIVFSLHYYRTIGLAISRNLFNMPREITDFLAFLALAVVFGLIARLLKALLDKVVKVQWHPLLEKFGGLIFGVFRAAITTSLVLIILALAPLPYLQRSIRDKSLTGVYFLKIGPVIYEKCAAFLPTLKIGAPSVNRNALVKELVSDKAVARKSGPTGEPEKEY
jgi:uncharacterized membrane protein required for colicin V production